MDGSQDPAPDLVPDLIPARIIRALPRHADRIAMQDGTHALSYRRLDAVARVLRDRIARPGPVAVYGLPGTALGAAVASAVMLGRPFVHLDPAMPDQVLRNILAELDIRTILTCQPVPPGRLPEDCAQIDAVACLTRDPGPDSAPLTPPDVAPSSPIYLVATSGTTGQPKCIPVTHDAAALSYDWRDGHTPYQPGMRVGIYIFAIWELLRPLRDGATLVFPALDDLMSPQALVGFLARNRIDEMLFTPSFLGKMLAALSPGQGTALPLSRVILNGEVVTPDLADLARRTLPGKRILNLYSICETHDISLTRLDADAPPPLPDAVGKAMPHLRAVVLDDEDRPCPPGQPGRLHFEGPRMLGPGYVNRPEETARRFRDLILEGRPVRLYDTGDQGSVEPCGTIRVMGRIAHMLKLRGHSIQTAELTATLMRHLDMQQAVPWIQDVPGQGQALILYYTAGPAQQARNQALWGLGDGWHRPPAALAQVLRAELPRYCIPTWLVRLDQLPIHPVSGKCDHRALPPCPPASAVAEDAAALPTLRRAAAILGTTPDRLEPSHSFHDQGGDSLMAVDFLLALEGDYARPVSFEQALALPLDRLHEVLSRDDAPAAVAITAPGILVTGATGFLGGHVLREAHRLLPPDQVIYCLVRPAERDPGQRLAERARDLGIPAERLVSLPGTLDLPLLGLRPQDHARLAARLTRVIHCAAVVNLALERDRMEAWAREGTDRILALCREAGAPLVFSSSIAVFPDRGGPYPEGPTRPFPGISGYGASKIAAEEAIAASGVDALILRLPSLYDLDAPNPRDINEAVLAACARMTEAPRGLCFPMTDVRAAARVLAGHVVAPGCLFATLTGPLPLRLQGRADVQDWLARAPLSEGERRLLSLAPEALQADAVLQSGIGQALHQALDGGPVSDPAAVLARRLGRDWPAYQGDPALTG